MSLSRSPSEQYTEKRLNGRLPLREATDVISEIDSDTTVVVSGFGSVGDPKAVPAALANSQRELELTVISGGSTGPDIDTTLIEAGAINRRIPYQSQKEARREINEGRLRFNDTHIARLGEAVETGAIADATTAIVEAVAVGPDWLIPTTSIGQTPAYVSAADQIIVEVNRSQPLELQQFHDIFRPGLPPSRKPIPLTNPGDRIGTPRIQFDPNKLVGVVETEQPDSPYTFREATDVDRAIAKNLVQFLDAEREDDPVLSERLTLQVGVGNIGNAIMNTIQEIKLGETDLVYYGEVIQDGLLNLIDTGALEVASATSLALSEEGQQRLFENVERYAGEMILRPAEISNRGELIDRFGVVAINSALEIDIYGHANSTYINGRTLVNGIGGSGDYNQNSYITILALPSRVNEERSRIIPHVPHVDHTAHDIDVVVTEQGVAELRGRDPRERAAAIIENCAHPDQQDALEQYVTEAGKEGGHVPFDPELAFDWVV